MTHMLRSAAAGWPVGRRRLRRRRRLPLEVTGPLEGGHAAPGEAEGLAQRHGLLLLGNRLGILVCLLVCQIGPKLRLPLLGRDERLAAGSALLVEARNGSREARARGF